VKPAQATARAARGYRWWLLRLVGLLGLLALQTAQAHLMVAQRGTLNFVGSGGFVVMALPVDAFTGVDDDGDGQPRCALTRATSKPRCCGACS
jgi:hypothetical protein